MVASKSRGTLSEKRRIERVGRRAIDYSSPLFMFPLSTDRLPSLKIEGFERFDHWSKESATEAFSIFGDSIVAAFCERACSSFAIACWRLPSAAVTRFFAAST